MERNKNPVNSDMGMEKTDKKFRFEFVKSNMEGQHYGNGIFSEGGWPILARASLGGVVLAETYAISKPYIYQSAGGRFSPETLIVVGLKVLDGKETSFQFNWSPGDIVLGFSPYKEDEVRISLLRERDGCPCLGTKFISFNPKKVKPVIEKRKAAAFELFNYHNDLVKDVIKYKDKGALELLVESQEDMLNTKRISDLFREYDVELAGVPGEL